MVQIREYWLFRAEKKEVYFQYCQFQHPVPSEIKIHNRRVVHLFRVLSRIWKSTQYKKQRHFVWQNQGADACRYNWLYIL